MTSNPQDRLDWNWILRRSVLCSLFLLYIFAKLGQTHGDRYQELWHFAEYAALCAVISCFAIQELRQKKTRMLAFFLALASLLYACYLIFEYLSGTN